VTRTRFGGAIKTRVDEFFNSFEAGALFIRTAQSVDLKNGSYFSTESKNTPGGNITIETKVRLYLQDSEISASVKGGRGSGGDINIDPIFVVLNRGKIKANAWGGSGGNIHIAADYFLFSPDSLVEASSQMSTPGEIRIQAVKIDASDALKVLDVTPYRASEWSETACSMMTGENVSRLIVTGRDAAPSSADDFLSGFESSLVDEILEADDDSAGIGDWNEPGLFEDPPWENNGECGEKCREPENQ
jgi:hypothetical protein